MFILIGAYDVDFENGWGIWSSDRNANVLWSLNTGPVKTLHTGPLGDHTLGGGGECKLKDIVNTRKPI